MAEKHAVGTADNHDHHDHQQDSAVAHRLIAPRAGPVGRLIARLRPYGVDTSWLVDVQELREVLSGLLTNAAASRAVRKDVPPTELASYCLHALAPASDSGTATAMARLVNVVLMGLTPPQTE